MVEIRPRPLTLLAASSSTRANPTNPLAQHAATQQRDSFPPFARSSTRRRLVEAHAQRSAFPYLDAGIKSSKIIRHPRIKVSRRGPQLHIQFPDVGPRKQE